MSVSEYESFEENQIINTDNSKFDEIDELKLENENLKL